MGRGWRSSVTPETRNCEIGKEASLNYEYPFTGLFEQRWSSLGSIHGWFSAKKCLRKRTQTIFRGTLISPTSSAETVAYQRLSDIFRTRREEISYKAFSGAPRAARSLLDTATGLEFDAETPDSHRG